MAAGTGYTGVLRQLRILESGLEMSSCWAAVLSVLAGSRGCSTVVADREGVRPVFGSYPTNCGWFSGSRKPQIGAAIEAKSDSSTPRLCLISGFSCSNLQLFVYRLNHGVSRVQWQYSARPFLVNPRLGSILGGSTDREGCRCPGMPGDYGVASMEVRVKSGRPVVTIVARVLLEYWGLTREETSMFDSGEVWVMSVLRLKV